VAGFAGCTRRPVLVEVIKLSLQAATYHIPRPFGGVSQLFAPSPDKDGDQWKPVENLGPYGVEKDGYNKVAFKPVTAGGLRLEVTMRPNWSAGLQEWKVK